MRARPLVSLCLLFALAGCAAPQTPASPDGFARCRPDGLLSVREALPDCAFPGVGDRPPVRLTALRGKPVILNFWASWCGNCVREMPAFDRVAASHAGTLVLVGLNLLGVQGETRAAAERFGTSTGVRYPLAYDRDGLLYGHFGTTSRPIMPLTVFVGADGTVIERHFGELTEQDLRALVFEHLGIR